MALLRVYDTKPGRPRYSKVSCRRTSNQRLVATLWPNMLDDDQLCVARMLRQDTKLDISRCVS